MALMSLWQIAQPLKGATINWTADSNANFNWATASNWSTGVPTGADDVLFPAPVPNPGLLLNPQTINLGAGSLANSLSFKDSYSLTGGNLTLGTGGARADWGMTATLGSQLTGSNGFIKTGGGAVHLSNNGNTYTGVTSINNGSLIISNQGALGTDASPVVINGSATRGFGGGLLVLEGGYTSGVNLTRNVSVQGLGPVSANGVALLSVRNNTISGLLSNGSAAVSTAMHSASGRLTLSDVTIGGTAGTTFMTFGAGNGVGAGSYEINGVLSGTGSIQKTGGGTLILTPSDASGFSGTLRVTAGSIRIASGSVLGTNAGTTTSGTLDLNGDNVFFEIRSDNPSINKNIYQRAISPAMFADHAIGSSMVNGTATLGALAFEEGETFSFNGRNGFGMTLGAAAVQGGTGNTTFNNNLGGLLTFTGAFWSNTDTTGVRAFTLGGNGNTLIAGNLTASGATVDHTFTKSGSGLLTITSIGSTLDGSVTINGGAMAITDFRSITNNSGTIHLGSTGTTAGSLFIGTSVTPNAAGLTTNKVINLNGTTAAAAIYASQSGTNPVIFNSSFTATGGAVGDAKTLTFGGTNTANNIVNGRIPNNAAGGTVNVAKNGPGTWVLAGDNTFTGTLTLTNGILKIQDTYAGGSRNVIASTAAVTFTSQSTTQEAGSMLEYVGATGSPSSESLGALTPSAGANTVKTTAGASGGTASLTFTSLGTVNNSASLNFISSASNPIIVTGQSGYNANRLYFNGADYAFFASGTVRAPIYGTDTLFSAANTFIASNHALITADSTTAAITQKSVKLDGNVTLNITGNLTLNNGSNTAGNILATGGSSTISGAGGITGPGSSVLGIRVNGVSDVLTINSNIIGGTGGLNKNGLGKLTLNGNGNTITGETRINEGEIELGAGARLGGNGTSTFTALTIRGTGVLDLGANSIGIAALNGSGTITSDGTGTATLTVGNADGTGTWTGVFKDGTGTLNITKTGTGAQTWSGISTYTGTTTIGSTGLVTVSTLDDIGQASSIGAGNGASDAANAASLVFNGSTGGLVYTGGLLNGAIAVGSTSASTNRLFTLAGTGATISSTASNNNAIVFSNPGAIVHGIVGPQNLILTGTSTGDNRMNPQITDSGTGANVTSVTKTGTGLWVLGNSNNTYTGATTVSNGILALANSGSLPSNSNLVIDGGVLQAGGSLTRGLGTGSGQLRFSTSTADTAKFSGGFAGGDTKLTVNLSGTPVWGQTANFIDGRNGLVLSSTAALSEVELAGGFSLGTPGGAAKSLPAMVTTSGSATVNGMDTSGLIVGQTITGPGIPVGAYIVSINSATQVTISSNASTGFGTGAGTVEASNLRSIRVDDNTTTFTDFATISGSISGDAGAGIRKLGGGVLQLFGENLYTGETNVNQGTLVVSSLGNSALAGGSSIGANAGANLASHALTLGNSGSGAGVLQYVGPGETSDRMIRLNTTTGSTQIHADGSGPLILTNVQNDMAAGAKLLYLRGANAQGNMITSVLTDNGSTLGIVADAGATWVLTGNNSYTGTVDVTSGALGIGHNNALGTGTIRFRNGSLFAYGADRTLSNPISAVSTTSAGTSTFVGDYNLTLTGSWTNPNTTVGHVFTNSIAAGKVATIGGNMSFDALTAGVTLTVNGPGDTVINGNITTSSVQNIAITYSGTGSLTLGGTGSQLNAGTITQSSGTLKIGGNNVLGTATTGNVVMSPAAGVSATLDLNGFNDTIRGLTATTAGTISINNSAAGAASLTFGNGDQAVNFIGDVKNTGAGALSLIKTGTAAASFSQGPFQHKGATTVLGGSLTLAADVSNTTSLSVTGTGSLLALTGGFTGSTGLASLTVGGGSTLSLLDGAGSLIPNLTNLSLGVGGSSTAALNLNIGTGATDTITLLNGGSLTLGNTITFNMNDAGLDANTTYTLLSIPAGGLSAFGLNKFLQGATPGGFSSFTWDVQDTYVRITTGNLITGNLYWRGSTNTAWNGNVNNWSTNEAGTVPASTIPGAGTDVIFQADGAAGGALVTTLEQNFKINSLAFEASSNQLTSVTVNPGTASTSRLDISPQSSSSGITMTAGGPSVVTVNTAVKLGTAQTWTVADASHSLTVTGALLGTGNLTKAGLGKVVLASAADATFGAASVNVAGGVLEIGNVAALGSTIAGNAAAITIGAGGMFYYNNATAGTVTNSLILNGGTLASGSAGGTASLTHTYSGPIQIQGDSTVSTRDLGTNVATGGTRTVTLSGVISGPGKMTVNGNTALSSGSSIAGTVILTQANPAWSGGMLLQQGTLDLRQESSLGTGAVSVERGRMLFKGATNTTWNQFANGLTVDAASGNAVVELQVDNQGTVGQFTTDITGTVTLGGSGASPFLRIYQADLLSNLNISGNVVLKANAGIHNSSAGNTNLGVPNLLSGVISESGGSFGLTVNGDTTWGSNNYQILQLDAANTFTGPITVGGGILDFSTVSNAGGAASNLGQGSTINLTGGNLRFIGDASQSTNRNVFVSANSTLSASGAGGATMTYTGVIDTTGLPASGTFSLGGTGVGNITGGIIMSGAGGLGLGSADLTPSAGTWNFSGTPSSLTDDFINTGSTVTVNLNSTGIITWGATGTSSSPNFYLRSGATGNLNANEAITFLSTGSLLLGDSGSGPVSTLNLNGLTQTVPASLVLGATTDNLEGAINGPGTLNVGTAITVSRGSISANLAGAGAIQKTGLGTVTFSGDNSGLTGGTAVRVDSGTLVLDYTASNADKLRAATGLDMRGGTLNINGNTAVPTVQTVASLTLASGGANIININAGTGQTATLNLGAFTRAVSAGTLRINLPSSDGFATTTTANGTQGLLGAGGFATLKDSTGTWFAINSNGTGLGNIVGLVSTTKNDVSTWTAGDHITDENAGFTGIAGTANINSLRFNAGGGAPVNVQSGGVLNIASGGVLVTDQVVAGSPGILGGSFSSNVTELIVTQDSARTFTVSSDIRASNAVTKTGNGTLALSGNNNYTGQTQIMSGLVQVAGGNAIGDTSVVTLADDRVSGLQLLNSETIGRLQGGSVSGGMTALANVAVGTHTLTLNTTGGNVTYSGTFTGTGTIIKTGSSNQVFANISDGFTGNLIINDGLVQLNNIGRIDAASIIINKNGTLLLDNNGTTRSGTRILDTANIILNSADGVFSGETIIRGLAFRTDQDSGTSNTETIGNLSFSSGASYASLQQNGTANSRAIIVAQNFVRENGATFNIRGRSLGSNASGTGTTGQAQLRIADGTNQTNFISSMIGGAGALGTTTQSIVPWAIAENTTSAIAATNMGNSLATYVSGRGFIALDLATEYSTYSAATALSNTREALGADQTGLAGKTLNSLVLHNNSAAAASYNVTGLGGGQALAVTSGAFLFTLNPSAVAGSYGINLSGFNNGITVGSSNEYVFHVVNPSNTTASVLTATVGSPLPSIADITKSGRGTLILTGSNTAGGGTRKTTLNEGILEIADLDNIGGNTGDLVFAGGTLRLSGSYSGDDLSSRNINFLLGGGTLDTNGVNLSLAGGLGSGVGGFTKAGAGTLTLGAVAGYTGPTTITNGTLTVGVSNAIGSGNLTVVGGGILALGTYNVSVGLVTTSGASPNITGTGTITAGNGYFFNHTGDTSIAALLAGSQGLVKAQTNTVTLSGLNTYAGVTEIQAGTLSIDSIANVGTASALGRPTSMQNGLIRMGLTTVTGGLTYTGAGHSTNRLIILQGTTGGATINASGTGALTLPGAQIHIAGNKTLTLGGTSDPALENRFGLINENSLGALTVAKSDTNTWLLTAKNSYSGSTNINNGILRLGVADALPAITSVRLGTGSTAGTLDLNGFNQTIAGLTASSNSTTATNQLIIDAGNTLTVNGNVTLGANVDNSTTLVTASGGGDLVVNSTGGIFQVGGATGSTNENFATVDFSGLTNFTADLGTAGIFRIGDVNSGTGPAFSTMTLATNNTITAGSFRVGDSSGPSNPNILTLGSGTNLINADTVNIGSAGTGIRSGGTLKFGASDTTGTVTIRGTAGGTTPAVINLVNTSGNTGGNIDTIVDFRGHTADVLASALTMATRSVGTGGTTSTLSFDQGKLEIGTLNMANRTTSGSTGGATAIVNLGDSAATGVPTTSIGSLMMAVNTSAGGTVSADLNVTGGNVTVGTGSGTAINMANAGTGRSVTSTIDLTGGTVTVDGNIIRTGGAGTESAVITLDGATLDMGSHSVGTTVASIGFTASSGILRNLGQLNGGSDLVKGTAGRLVLEGVNTYTGNTLVNGGTLLVNNVTGSGTGSGNVTVSASALLGGVGTISGPVSSAGTLSPGSMTSGGASLIGKLTVGALSTSVGSSLAFQLGGVTTTDAINVANYQNNPSGFTVPASWTTYGSSTEHDHISVTGGTPTINGIVSISGTYLNGFSPAYGQIFQFLDWATLGTTSIAGSRTFDLPALPNALNWNTDLFSTHGLVFIVPEPGRMLLLLLGLLSLAYRRRR